MRAFMKSVLGLAALFAATLPAQAQVGVVPSPGLTTNYLSRTTYSAAFIGLVPAASTTDLACIAGAASKTIKLQSIKISGSGTAISIPVTILKRVAADTGGTPAGTTANPANTISKRDSGNPNPVATLIAYTANPTIVDTSPTYIGSEQLGVVATTVGVLGPTLNWDWAKDIENFLQPPTLKGAAEQICVNLNATSATALLTGSFTWTEE